MQKIAVFKIFLPALQGRASARQSASLRAAACGGISARSAASSFVVVYGGTPVVCGFMAAWVLLAALPCLRRGPSQWDGKE